ncbi:hypothetical protein EC957_008080 [Mortierella hygrophila]|uniref:F-box domain-containing protein n=1 Tax=Mortierella hygrophila TaxID=979708 RepID=A0A9P6JXQ8_9FUNG|nr:hypothetical protein EC957_008080 [Mortierella hygrophila]
MTVHQSSPVLLDDNSNNGNNKVNHTLALTTPTTPTCRDPMTLPPEILRWIVSHLQSNRHALHACLLVSRAWSQAAVEYLYKAEHIMGDYDFRSFSTISVPTFAFDGLTLEDDPVTLVSLGSPRIPIGSAAMFSSKESSELSLAMVPLQQSSILTHNKTRNDLEGFRSEARSRLLLKRTLDASLLHDAQCSYDYISYLNKVSCPWFVDLIQDWSEFCSDWRGTSSREQIADHSADLPLDSEPSIARQEHRFNRLVRKVSKRCRFVDEFRSSSMVHPNTLIYAVQHFQKLTWVDLKDCQELNDDVFKALARTVRALSYLRLPGSKLKKVSAQAISDVILAQEKDTLCQFKVIHGTNIFENDSILKAIGERHGGSMKRLTLAISELEHSGLQEYGPLCTGLVSLNLEYTSGVTDDVLLPILDTCRQLVKLDLTETDCTQATIQGLSTASDATIPQTGRFATMKRLILNNVDSPFTTNIFLALADACPNLEELHMNSILADSFQDFQPFIVKMTKLKDLDIGNVFPELTDASMISIVDALPDLRWISVANTQITNASLAYLSEKASNLCDLCILGCDQVTKDGLIAFLDNMTNKTGFRRLDIAYCRLDEAAIAEIREKAKELTIRHGLNELIEVEGDDQFADSLADEEGEREEGAEDDEEEGEDEAGEFEEIVEEEGQTTLEEIEEDEEEILVAGLDAAVIMSQGSESEAEQTDEDESSEEEEDLSDYSDAFSDVDEDDLSDVDLDLE